MRAAAYRLLDTGGSAEEEACRTYLRVDDGHQRDEGEREEIVLGKKHIGDKRREGRVRRGRRRGRGKKDEFAVRLIRRDPPITALLGIFLVMIC